MKCNFPPVEIRSTFLIWCKIKLKISGKLKENVYLKTTFEILCIWLKKDWYLPYLLWFINFVVYENLQRI